MATFVFGQTNTAAQKDLSSDRRESVKGPDFNFSPPSQPRSIAKSDDKQVTVTEAPCSRSLTPVTRRQFNSAPFTPPSSSTRTFETRQKERQEPRERLSSFENALDSSTKQRPILGQLDTPPLTIDQGTRFGSRVSASREDESLEYSTLSPGPAILDNSPCPSPSARKSTLRHGHASMFSIEEPSSQSQDPEENLSAKTRIHVQHSMLNRRPAADGGESSCSSPEDSRKPEPESPIESSTLSSHKKRPQTPELQSAVHDNGSRNGNSHDGKVYKGRSHTFVPENFVVTPATKNSSAQPAITPDTEIRMKVKDLESLFHSFLSQLPQSSFVLGTPVKTEETEASPVLTASLIKQEGNADTTQIFETPKYSPIIKSSQSSPLIDDLGLNKLESTVKEENVVSDQQPSAPAVTLEKYTEEIWSSWLPNDMRDYKKRREIEGIVEKMNPSKQDGYIYVYCEASGSGYVEPGSGRSLPGSEEYPANLPLFRRADGEMLSLSEALLDKSENSRVSRGAHESTTKDPPPSRNLRIKIGRSASPKERFNTWEKSCNRAIMLLLLYDSDAGIGPLSNPAPIRHSSFRDLPDDSYGAEQSPARHANPYPSKVNWNAVMKTPGLPHCDKVEQIIARHLHKEKTKRTCKGTKKGKPCQVNHREWFEIPDTVEGIQRVDTVIQRWIAWAKEREVYARDQNAYNKANEERKRQEQPHKTERDFRAERREARAKEAEARTTERAASTTERAARTTEIAARAREKRVARMKEREARTKEREASER